MKFNNGTYETNGFRFDRDLNTRADSNGANVKQPATQKSVAEADCITRRTSNQQRPPDRATAHVFNSTVSPAVVFNSAVPRPDL
jgi:hypothetical protein